MVSAAAGGRALVLVDGINSFYDPTGSNFYPESAETVDPILALLAQARADDCLVVHAVERHLPGLVDFEWRKLPEHCLVGEHDSEIYPPFLPAARQREVEVAKRRFSAFFATDLALLLPEQQVETVVLAGVKTNVCVRATAQDAFAWGFTTIVPREATNSNRPHLAAASLEDIDRYMGKVVSLDDALDRL